MRVSATSGCTGYYLRTLITCTLLKPSKAPWDPLQVALTSTMEERERQHPGNALTVQLQCQRDRITLLPHKHTAQGAEDPCFCSHVTLL